MKRLKKIYIRICSVLKYFDSQTIYFEGGLGSQLFSYLEFLNQLEDFESGRSPYKPRCNLDYFDSQIGFLEGGLRIGPWLLDAYNVSLDSLKAYESSLRERRGRIRAPLEIIFEKRGGANFLYKLCQKHSGSLKSNRDISSFVFNEMQLEIDEVLCQSQFNCCTIHIRRGDFLNVASKIIDESDYLELLRKIRISLPKFIVIFSDSKLDENLKHSMIKELPDHSIIFCDGSQYDLVAVHDFMRRSKILITGNSMFSLSAGMLAPRDSLVFIPISFYHDQPSIVEFNPFLTVGKYFILGGH